MIRSAATIATRSHLARAHCMATSFLAHHPDGDVTVLLVDGPEPAAVFGGVAVATITVTELEIPGFATMRARYSTPELANALKPYLLRHLLDEGRRERMLYLDSDLYIVDTLVPDAFDVLDHAAILLTPHLRSVPGSGADLVAHDLAVLFRGSLNGGFVGVRAGSDAAGFLEWWAERVTTAGYQRPDRGMNADQRWLDLLPGLDLDLAISKHPGMNVAYWNLHERTISHRDGRWFSNDAPLRFVHFSGFDIDDPTALTSSWSQFDLVNRPDIAGVASEYRAALRASMVHIDEATRRTRPPSPLPAGHDVPSGPDAEVSVVIPTRNGASTLADAVDGALAQTGVRIEVIVVDDGSTDDPASVLPTDPRVRMISTDDRGVSNARNRGWAAGRGRMVIFLDANDSITDPRRVRDQLALFDDQPELAVVLSGWEVIDERGEVVVTRRPWMRLRTLDLEGWTADMAVRPGAMAFRRESLQAVGGFDPSLPSAEDLDVVIRLLLGGWAATWLERVTTRCSRHAENASHDVDAQADALAVVLDRLFADPEVPQGVVAKERPIRYRTHVWLGSRYQRAGCSSAMVAQLAAAALWADVPVGRLALDWVQHFVDAGVDAGDPPLDVSGLVSDPAWQALIRTPAGTVLEWGVTAGVTAPAPRSAAATGGCGAGGIWSCTGASPDLPPAALDISEASGRSFGRHRSGWALALDALTPLHVEGGVFLDAFVEQTFDAPSRRPHASPWVGFLHNPPELPAWYPIDQSAARLLADERFRASLPTCRGLFTLSTSLRDWWAARVDVPVEAVPLPGGRPLVRFAMDGFGMNPFPRVVQVGTWLRKLHAIHHLPVRRLRRTIVHQHAPYIDELIAAEREALKLVVDASLVETLPYLDDTAYDELLSCNLVFAELYGASANNVVIECLRRGTPILVNPLPAVREYLGDDYPLYFSSRTEAARKAENPDLVAAAHSYLVSRPEAEQLTGTHFAAAVAASTIYQGLL